MNIRRGLFRVWLVLSVLWVAVGVGLLWSNLTAPWKVAPASLEKNEEILSDFTIRNRQPSAPGETPVLEVELPDGTIVEFPDKTPRDMIGKALRKHFQARRFEAAYELRRRAISPLFYIVLLPPIGLLIIGCAFFWAFSGFRR